MVKSYSEIFVRLGKVFSIKFYPSPSQESVHHYNTFPLMRWSHMISDSDDEVFLHLRASETEPAGTSGSRGSV